MPRIGHAIENLPKATRDEVLNAILAGETLTSVSVRLHVSRQAVSSWYNRVVKPAISVAQKTQSITRAREDYPLSTQQVISEQHTLTRDLVKASPVRERVESVWAKTLQFMGECDVDNGAPILNAATKQVELLARLTGELKDNTGASLTLNIVCPAGEDKQRVDFSDPDAIEMGFE